MLEFQVRLRHKLETVHSGQTKWYNLNSCERLKKLSNFRSFWMHSDILHFKSPFLLRVSVSYFYNWICCTISFRCVSTCTVICKNKNANFYQFLFKNKAITDERNDMELGNVFTVHPYRLQGNKTIVDLLNLMYGF